MVSRDYLTFSSRERTGIITLVFLLVIVAVLPKFFCHPNRIAEKLPEKDLQQLATLGTGYYPQKKYGQRDTVYVQSVFKKNYYPRYTYRDKYKKINTGSPITQRRQKLESGPLSREPRQQHSPWVRPALSPIDINTADTTAFIALPGIGSKLANRIIAFRTKLGGFSDVDQIREVYGLKDSVFQIIHPFLSCNTMLSGR